MCIALAAAGRIQPACNFINQALDANNGDRTEACGILTELADVINQSVVVDLGATRPNVTNGLSESMMVTLSQEQLSSGDSTTLDFFEARCLEGAHFNGIANATATGCQDPEDNGSTRAEGTVSITGVNAALFQGTAQFSAFGGSYQDLYGLRGTLVRTTGAGSHCTPAPPFRDCVQTSRLEGNFENTLLIDGEFDSDGTGDFTGTLEGGELRLEGNGRDICEEFDEEGICIDGDICLTTLETTVATQPYLVRSDLDVVD